MEAAAYKKVATDLAGELHTTNQHLQKMQDKLVHVETKLMAVKGKNRNILRHSSIISRQEEKNKMERQSFESDKSKLKLKLKEKEEQHKVKKSPKSADKKQNIKMCAERKFKFSCSERISRE